MLGFIQGSEWLIIFACFGIPLAVVILILIVRNFAKKKGETPPILPMDNESNVSSSPPENRGNTETEEIRLKLREYDDMLNEGLISKDDYDELKRKLLGL